MKFVAVIIGMILVLNTSQASTTIPSTNLKIIVLPAKTAIKKDQVLAKSPRIPKPKLFRSNPSRIAHYLVEDDNDDFGIQDEDIAPFYRKRDVVKIKASPHPDDPEGDISEDIRWKLFLARQYALIKYREKWKNLG